MTKSAIAALEAHPLVGHARDWTPAPVTVNEYVARVYGVRIPTTKGSK